MKKILLYTDTPIAGGAELQMFLLAKFLNKNKYEPTICISNFPQLKDFEEKCKKEGIKVKKLKVVHKHDPRHFFQLKKLIKKEKYDILHCHIWNPASCRYALLAGKSTKTPIVTTEHDPFPLPFLKNLIKKIQLNYISRIINISESNKKFFETEYPNTKNKLRLVHNGIDIEELENELSKCIKHPSKEKILCTVAALHKRKGIHYLIEAFSRIKNRENLKLIIAGSGPDEREFRDQAKGLNIEFLGQRKDIPQILKNSDYFVLPSAREGFGLAVLEAMCAKLPILATNAGGIPEIINSDKYGIIVEKQNTEALLEGLNKILKLSTEELDKMSESEYGRLKSEFNAKKMAEKTEKVYEQCDSTQWAEHQRE